MRGSRSLLGVILIALVLSTVVTLFIIGEEEGIYSVVSNEYRSAGGTRFISGVALLMKQPVSWLSLSHYCLMNRTELIAGRSYEGTPEEICLSVAAIEAYMNMSEFHQPKRIHIPVEIPIWIDEETMVEREFDLYLFDFSKVVWEAVPDEIMYSTDRPVFRNSHLWDFYSTFACLFDEDGDLTYFFVGVADFYLNKILSLEELTVERNENETEYLGLTEEGRIREGSPSVLTTPDRGFVLFEDLERNDRLGVKFHIDPNAMPQSRRTTHGRIPIYQLIHIVEIETSTGGSEYLVNMVEPPKPRPRT